MLLISEVFCRVNVLAVLAVLAVLLLAVYQIFAVASWAHAKMQRREGTDHGAKHLGMPIGISSRRRITLIQIHGIAR